MAMLLSLEKLSWYLPTAGQLRVLITRLCCPTVSLRVGLLSEQGSEPSNRRPCPRCTAGAQHTLTGSNY